MQAEFEHLLILQERDMRLQDIHTQLERIPRDKEFASERLAHSKTLVEAAKAAQQENEVAIKKVELDVGTRRQTISRLKTQQFETRKNEEYQALKHEIDRYTKEVDGLETQELELMEKADQLRNSLQEAEGALARLQAGVDEEISLLDQRSAALGEEVVSVQEKRDAEMTKLSEDLYSLYSRLLASRGAPVVVELSREGQCRGCHVKAISSIAVRVQGGKELVQCENCGRVLYPE
jgi:predicted  nucleic acid-binding Zn-ribbon protein